MPAPRKPPAGGSSSSSSDQKRALLLGAGAIGLYLLYRRARGGGSSAAATGPAPAAFGQMAPYTPQSPITIPAGESIYDPNSGNLLTPAGNTQPAGQAAAAAAPAYTVNVNYPPHVSAVAAANHKYLAPGASSPNYRLTPPRNAPKGAVWSGTKSPGGGFTGIGGGWYAPHKATTAPGKKG